MMAVTPVFAQSPAGSSPANQAESKEKQLGMDVTVVDPTNAVIPNAKVSLCRCKDRATNNISADSTGVARFRSLAKGTYQISVQAPGSRRPANRGSQENGAVPGQAEDRGTNNHGRGERRGIRHDGHNGGVLTAIQNSPISFAPMSGARQAPLQK